MLAGSEKAVHTIGEVSELLDIEPHTLRYWEKEFKDFIKPRRNGRKARTYSQWDIANLQRIQYLLNVELYTIAGARRQMYLRDSA